MPDLRSRLSDRARFLRFVANGVLATGVHFGVLTLNLEVFHLRSAGIANFVAALFGIAASFVGNRYAVFEGADTPLLPQAARFLALYAFLALFQGFFLALWADFLHFDYRIGFLVAAGGQMVISFLGNKLLVFAKK
jgi:putative flippase GtrA